jgi:hypothetical protein
MEGTKHFRSTEPIDKPTQRLGILGLESAPERFRIGSQSLKSNAAVKGCVCRILLS